MALDFPLDTNLNHLTINAMYIKYVLNSRCLLYVFLHNVIEYYFQ